MSTLPTVTSQPAAGWYPSLQGTNLPQAAITGIVQSFNMIYSLRDVVSQLQNSQTQQLKYDTHLTRKQANAQAVPAGMLWFESDRATVFYQTRMPSSSTTQDWFYAGGIYYDQASKRPGDLDYRDTGFLFLDSGAGNQMSRWNGQGWDNV